MLNDEPPREYCRALVTGGAGFIGSHLVEALRAESVEVVVLDNLSLGKRENLPDDVRLVEADLRDPAALADALEGVDIVFHNAARVSIRSSMDRFVDDADQNIMGTLQLLEACGRHGAVAKLVVASSMAVYADAPERRSVSEGHALEPISPYGIAKLACEKYCLTVAPTFGIEPVVLRYFNTYGTRQTHSPYVGVVTIFIKKLLAGEPVSVYGDGEQVRDFVAVGDIVQANLAAMKRARGGSVYNVGSGTGTSVRRLAELLLERMAPGGKAIHLPAHPGELRYSVADLARTRAEIGYVPASNFEQDLPALIAHHRAQNSSG